jgi:hypothetical protein
VSFFRQECRGHEPVLDVGGGCIFGLGDLVMGAFADECRNREPVLDVGGGYIFGLGRFGDRRLCRHECRGLYLDDGAKLVEEYRRVAPAREAVAGRGLG